MAFWRDRRKEIIFCLIFFLIFSAVSVYAQEQSKSAIVQAYKELDQLDLKLQNAIHPSDKNTVEKISEIYCGPQLQKATAYFEELVKKNLRFKIRTADYKNIKVLEHDKESAVLLVDSEYNGDYLTWDKGETLREIAVDLVCQVHLRKDKGKWKISDVVTLKEYKP